MLLVIGVGMSASLTLFDSRSPAPRVQVRSENSLIDSAIVVAQATDAETGRQFARQIAALSGRVLTDEELDAISAADGGRG